VDRRTRNRLCIWIIGLGLANLLAYTVSYAYLQGDAANGEIRDGKYFVRGHFLHGPEGKQKDVGRSTWIYSYVHSISVWPTEGMVLVALLILARPHIIATMKEDGMVNGQTFVTICITIIVVIVSAITFWFTLDFLRQLGVSRTVPVVFVLAGAAMAVGYTALRRRRVPLAD
jgi:hypothetical protein